MGAPESVWPETQRAHEADRQRERELRERESCIELRERARIPAANSGTPLHGR